MYYISQKQFFHDLKGFLIYIKKHFKVDTLFCIKNGSLMVGQYLSYKLDKPLYIIDYNKKSNILTTTFDFNNTKNIKNILVVDEILDTGATIFPVVDRLHLEFKKRGLYYSITPFCLYGKYPEFKNFYYLQLPTSQYITFFWERRRING